METARASRFISSAICVLALAVVVAATGCNHSRRGVAINVVTTQDYQPGAKHPPKTEIAFSAPSQPFVIVGTIEIRADRPKEWSQLRRMLCSQAADLGADLVIPPDETSESAGRQRAFYLYDDGRNVIVLGMAIRLLQK